MTMQPERLDWRPGPLLVGVGVLVLSAISFYGIYQIPVSVFGGPVGPRTFPTMITVGLATCGVMLVVASLRNQFSVAPDDRLAWRTCLPHLGWFFGGLLANLVLIVPLGFIVASAPMFSCVARAFGDRRMIRNAVIGFIFAAIVYSLFRFVLGVYIGIGPWGLLGEAIGVR